MYSNRAPASDQALQRSASGILSPAPITKPISQPEDNALVPMSVDPDTTVTGTMTTALRTAIVLTSYSLDTEALIALVQMENSYHLTIPATENQDEVHIFSIVGNPIYGTDKRHKVYIAIPIGPVQLIVSTEFYIRTFFLLVVQLDGYVDFVNLEVDIKVYIKLPIVPRIKIAEFKGNLKDGITVAVSAGGIIKGSLTLFVQNYEGRKWIWIHVEVTVYKKTFNFETRVIPFPQ
jgi:hypothetical protein